MWVLRRASTQLRIRGLKSHSARILYVKSKIGSVFPENYYLTNVRPQEKIHDEEFSLSRSYASSSFSSKFQTGICSFSSEAGAKNSVEEDDDLKYAFCESDVSENEDLRGEGELKGVGSETIYPKVADNSMTRALLAAPLHSVNKFMDKWVEEGNEVNAEEVMISMSYLWKHRFFVKALQLSEWLEAKKKIDFDEQSCASRVDLIAKVCSLAKAEEYLDSIPDSFKGEMAYRMLLNNCVSATNLKKAEEVFGKMRKLGLPLTCSACNQLIRLYKRFDRKKIAGILSLMDKENIKPTLYTYQLLVEAKGMAQDITGMETVVEDMKTKGVEPDPSIQISLVRCYIIYGLKDKVETVLKEMEGVDLENNRWVCRMLLPIYASLRKEEEVARIWKMCESETRLLDYVAAIEAWGQLGKIENAESAFEKLLEKVSQPSAKHYAPLLNVYANHSMLSKGEDLMRRMSERGCSIGPLTWDALVTLYVRGGEVEKAHATLKKSLGQKYNFKPFFRTFSALLSEYEKRGDVRNAEEIFSKMRQAGYVPRLQSYESLLRAYVNARTPAYGFVERMKADKLFPNKVILADMWRIQKNSMMVDLID